MGNQSGKALKWLPAYFNFERRNVPKLERGRPITVRDWPLVHPFNGRRAAVKTGYKSVHFSLDGCPLSCYFSGSVTATSRHFALQSRMPRDKSLWKPRTTKQVVWRLFRRHTAVCCQQPVSRPACSCL